MYKIKLPQGSVYKSYDIQELANIVLANKKLTFEFYVDYKMISPKDFIDLYFKETNNTLTQRHLIDALSINKSLLDIYKKKEINTCSCCNRQSVGVFQTIKEKFVINYCSKHKEQMLKAVYIYCTHGESEYIKYITDVI